MAGSDDDSARSSPSSAVLCPRVAGRGGVGRPCFRRRLRGRTLLLAREHGPEPLGGDEAQGRGPLDVEGLGFLVAELGLVLGQEQRRRPDAQEFLRDTSDLS